MKCPLMHWVKVTTHGESSSECMDCLKEECAWWRMDWGACVLYVVSQELDTLSERLSSIARELTLLRPK